MKTQVIENILCKIGENAVENWKLYDEAKEEHLFFHLSSFPSCYVILETSFGQVSDTIIKSAALACLKNTKYLNIKNIKVDYTFCGNISKGDKVGEIIYKSNKKVKKIKLDHNTL